MYRRNLTSCFFFSTLFWFGANMRKQQRTSVDRHLHDIIQVVVLAAVKGAVVADTADGENEGAGITFHPTAEECN